MASETLHLRSAVLLDETLLDELRDELESLQIGKTDAARRAVEPDVFYFHTESLYDHNVVLRRQSGQLASEVTLRSRQDTSAGEVYEVIKANNNFQPGKLWQWRPSLRSTMRWPMQGNVLEFFKVAGFVPHRVFDRSGWVYRNVTSAFRTQVHIFKATPTQSERLRQVAEQVTSFTAPSCWFVEIFTKKTPDRNDENLRRLEELLTRYCTLLNLEQRVGAPTRRPHQLGNHYVRVSDDPFTNAQ